MRPSGNTRHVSVFSWGRASARYGRGDSWASCSASPALNARRAESGLPGPRSSRSGLLPRLSGARPIAITKVRDWAVGALVAAGWPAAGGAVDDVGGLHARQ